MECTINTKAVLISKVTILVVVVIVESPGLRYGVKEFSHHAYVRITTYCNNVREMLAVVVEAVASVGASALYRPTYTSTTAIYTPHLPVLLFM